MVRQTRPAHGAKKNRGNGGAFNPPIGANQMPGFGQFRDDAVFGRAIGGGADADQGIPEQRIDAQEDGQRTQHLDQIGGEQHAGFRIAIGKSTDPRRERHEGDKKGALQGRDVPGAAPSFLQAHGDHREQDGVVAKGGQELRANQSEQALVHSPNAL